MTAVHTASITSVRTYQDNALRNVNCNRPNYCTRYLSTTRDVVVTRSYKLYADTQARLEQTVRLRNVTASSTVSSGRYQPNVESYCLVDLFHREEGPSSTLKVTSTSVTLVLSVRVNAGIVP